MAKKKNNKNRVEWRTAVQETMREATEKELIDRHGTLDVSFNYRWEHVVSVVRLAMRLAELTGADVNIVEAAAWLHDVRKETGEQHPIEGARFAREFLRQTDFPVKKIDGVAVAIEQHSGLWRQEPLTNLEAMVLWDADKLAKIGLTAVFHWTGGSLAGNRITNVQAIIDRAQKVNWHAKTVASMHTEPARRAALARMEAFDWLWHTLETELNAEDLQPVPEKNKNSKKKLA